MVKRLTDLLLAGGGLLLAIPILVVAAVGIRLSSPGPVLYRARLTGRRGRIFTMYKLRTMHVAEAGRGSPITAARDPRVFPFGAFLRRTKLDELPQLLNILRGEMSLVGPRPEHPDLVPAVRSAEEDEVLAAIPGLTSPGTLFDYTHGEEILGPEHATQRYVEHLQPMKLALDLVYVRNASWRYDAELILRTLAVIGMVAAGRRHFPPPRELAAARALLRRPSPVRDTSARGRMAEAR